MRGVTELDRKTLIWLIDGRLRRQPRNRQRGGAYGPGVHDALRVITEGMDCSGYAR
jgi:hypothetical protein